MGEKRKNKDRLCTILMIVFFSILAILVILPIYTIFLASFKPGGDLLQYGLTLGIDWSRMSLDNYVLLFTGQHDYWRWFFNSITLTVVTVVATLLVSAFVGYGFAAYEFKGKNFMFVIVLLILSVPLEVIMLPLYKQMTTWITISQLYYHSLHMHLQSSSSDSIFWDFRSHFWKQDESTEQQNMVSSSS